MTAEPTYYDVGIKTYTCTVCGYFYTTAIPRLNPSGYCGGEGDGTNLTWTLDWNTGVLTISGTGKMADYGGWGNPAPWCKLDFSAVSIGSGVTTIGDHAFNNCYNLLTSVTIGGNVTTIGEGAFEWCYSLTSVTIPDSVTTIGDYAFYNCHNLTSMTIPDNVTTIGYCVFCGCDSLMSVTIGGNVTTIGDYAFCGCDSLMSVTIGGNVTTIGDHAFYNCYNLTSVTIPDNVTTIGEKAFEYCDSLTTFTVDSNNPSYSNDGCGVLFNKNKTELIQYPIGNLRESYAIPDSVTTIGDYAFYNCESLTSVTIPDSVTSIGEGAFEWCYSLTSVTIPDSVTTIGDGAFEGCNNLADVTIPDTVTRIGDWAFNQTPWLESLGDFATVNGILLRYQGEDTSVTVPETVTKIAGAFCYCENITDITIPASVTEFSSWYIFGKCLSLKNLTFLGDAPFVSETDNIFEEFRDDLIIHAPKNNTTWTDSSLYDADAQTWSGCHIVFDVEPQSVASDLNGDSSTDAADLAILARHVAKIELITDIDKENLADVNGDTFVTAGDLTALARLIKTQEAA